MEKQMPNDQQNNEKAFMIEKIKERPINKRKLLKKTLGTAATAVMFGLIASLTFLVLQPYISKILYPEEKPQIIVFPEDENEMSPEEMLAENQQNSAQSGGENISWENVQTGEEMMQFMLSKDGYMQMYNALNSYVAELERTMVSVTGIHSGVDWFNEVQVSQYRSSGVVIADNGVEFLILTNYAPLEGADKISVTFYNSKQLDAELKSYDSVSGLAIVAVAHSAFGMDEEALSEEVHIAKLGTSVAGSFVGTPVVAIGSPTGMVDSVSYGMITARYTQQTVVDRNYSYWTTDIMGTGNSDGVLFNLQGQIVGVITDSVNGSDYKNTVIIYGITELKKTIEKLSNDEVIPYIGVHTTNVSKEANEEMQVPYGAYVKRVEIDSPAMIAGLQVGDVITAIGEKEIKSLNNYATALMQLEIGRNAEITIMRRSQNGYKEIKLHIVPAQAR